MQNLKTANLLTDDEWLVQFAKLPPADQEDVARAWTRQFFRVEGWGDFMRRARSLPTDRSLGRYCLELRRRVRMGPLPGGPS